MATRTPALDFEYTPNWYDSNTVTIDKYTGPGGVVVIPSTLGGKAVNSIKDSAFSGCQDLVSVTIPGSVHSLGFRAFAYCTNLTDITLSPGVGSLGQNAFSSCVNLRSILLPETVSWIGDHVFWDCWALTNVNIPCLVEKIPDLVFLNCTNLLTITVSDSNTAYCSLDGVLFTRSTNTLVHHPAGRTGTYTIPDSVTNINVFAFPEGSRLTNIRIGAGALQIVRFRSTNVRSIDVSERNPRFRSVDGVVFGKDLKRLVIFPMGRGGSYTIPDGVIRIEPRSFSECANLTGITIPGSVKTIRESAFWDCTRLTSLVIPGSITNIEREAFIGCPGLTNLVITNSSALNIAVNAFAYCTNLTSVYVDSDAPTVEKDAFKNTQATFYRQPAAKGWSETLDGRPVKLWNPAAKK